MKFDEVEKLRSKLKLSPEEFAMLIGRPKDYMLKLRQESSETCRGDEAEQFSNTQSLDGESKMGYWGSGIFDNDYSMCTLSELLRPIHNKIKECLIHERLIQWDEVEADHVVIGMKIIMALDDVGLPMGQPPNIGLARGKLEYFKAGWKTGCDDDTFHMQRLKAFVVVWEEYLRRYDRS